MGAKFGCDFADEWIRVDGPALHVSARTSAPISARTFLTDAFFQARPLLGEAQRMVCCLGSTCCAGTLKDSARQPHPTTPRDARGSIPRIPQGSPFACIVCLARSVAPTRPAPPKKERRGIPPVADNAESDSEGPARGAKRLIASSNRRAANLPGGRTECPSPRTLPPASGCGRRPSQIPALLRPLGGDSRTGRRPRRRRGRRACGRGRQRRGPSAEDPHAGGPRRCP